MAIIQPPTIPAVPTTVPLRGNKNVFSAAFEAFLVWFLGNFALIGTAINSAYTNALEAFNSANVATSAAAAALATSNATLWVSGVTVQQYAAVISPLDGRTYRRVTTAGSGATDPSADFSNYVLLSTTPTAYVPLVSATVTTAVTNIDFLNVFTGAYDKYIVEIEGVLPTSPSALNMRLAKAGVVDSTASAYAAPGGEGSTATFSTTLLTMFSDVSSTGIGCSGTVEIRNVNDAAGIKTVGVRGFAVGNSSTAPRNAEGAYNSTAVSGFRLYWASGTTFAKGTIRVYGIKNS